MDDIGLLSNFSTVQRSFINAESFEQTKNKIKNVDQSKKSIMDRLNALADLSQKLDNDLEIKRRKMALKTMSNSISINEIKENNMILSSLTSKKYNNSYNKNNNNSEKLTNDFNDLLLSGKSSYTMPNNNEVEDIYGKKTKNNKFTSLIGDYSDIAKSIADNNNYSANRKYNENKVVGKDSPLYVNLCNKKNEENQLRYDIRGGANDSIYDLTVSRVNALEEENIVPQTIEILHKNIELSAHYSKDRFLEDIIKGICINLKTAIASFGCVALGISTTINPAIFSGLSKDLFVPWDKVHLFLLDGDLLEPTNYKSALRMLSRTLFRSGTVKPASFLVPPLKNVLHGNCIRDEYDKILTRDVNEAIVKNSMRYDSLQEYKKFELLDDKITEEQRAISVYSRELKRLVDRKIPIINIISVDSSFSICGLNKTVYNTPNIALRKINNNGPIGAVLLPKSYIIQGCKMPDGTEKTVTVDESIADLFGDETEAPNENLRSSDIVRQKLQFTATLAMIQSAECQIIICEDVDTWNTMLEIKTSSCSQLLDNNTNKRIRAYILGVDEFKE